MLPNNLKENQKFDTPILTPSTKAEYGLHDEPISKEEIEAKLSEAEDLILADSYKEKRSKEYPTIRDQLDDIYHNGVAGWKTTIKAVKDKYPKG